MDSGSILHPRVRKALCGSVSTRASSPRCPRRTNLSADRLFLRAIFRFKSIQIPKQMLDLRGLRFGQAEFVLYAMQASTPICRLQHGFAAKCAQRRHHHTRNVRDVFIHCHAITPRTSPFSSRLCACVASGLSLSGGACPKAAVIILQTHNSSVKVSGAHRRNDDPRKPGPRVGYSG